MSAETSHPQELEVFCLLVDPSSAKSDPRIAMLSEGGRGAEPEFITSVADAGVTSVNAAETRLRELFGSEKLTGKLTGTEIVTLGGAAVVLCSIPPRILRPGQLAFGTDHGIVRWLSAIDIASKLRSSSGEFGESASKILFNKLGIVPTLVESEAA